MRVTVTNKPAKKTRTAKKPAKKGKTTRTKKGGLKAAKATQRLNGRDLEPEDIGQSPVASPRHALYVRHLCPVCPDGVTPQKRSLMERMVGSIVGSDGTQYCGWCTEGRGDLLLGHS